MECQALKIKGYSDFVSALLEAGFSMGGGNSEGVFAVVPWSWDGAPPYDTPVRWHTGDPETDPWEWRMRVLDERTDIAYAKLFFRKSGFITRAWYPRFLAARRKGLSFDDAYRGGTVSQEARRIVETLREHGALPLHALKPLAGFGREDKAAFERALVDLQMNMHITMCGRQQKLSQAGLEYGWSSTVFCTVERFFGGEAIEEAVKLGSDEAAGQITEQIYRLNPNADAKKIKKFISG